MQQPIEMTSLTNRLSRPGAIIHQGYGVGANFQGYKHASNSGVSNVRTDANHAVKECHDTSLRSNSKNIEKFSDGPDLAEFIAGVVPRYIKIYVYIRDALCERILGRGIS